MSPRDGSEAPSPSVSSIRLPLGPLGRGSRRGSLASTSSKVVLDRETVNQALDHIHNSASRSETLITFDEFASPPPSSHGNESRGIAADLVPSGLSGLYSRIKATVGSVREPASVAPLPSTIETSDDLSLGGTRTRELAKGARKSAATSLSSPAVTSASSSRLNSPLAAAFPESQITNKRYQESVDSSSRPNSGASRLPLLLAPKSKPSVAASALENHSLDAINDEERRSSITGATASNASLKPKDTPTNSSRTSSVTSSRPPNESRLSGGPQLRASHGLRELPGEDSDSTHDDVTHGIEKAETVASFGSSHDSLLVEDSQAKEALRRMSNNNPTLAGRRDVSPAMGSNYHADAANAKRPVAPTSASGTISQRPPLLQISQSHLPGFRISRASSSDGGLSSVTTTTVAPSRQEQYFEHRPLPQLRPLPEALPNSTFPQLGRKVLSREFWMRDENAKDCFYCGDSFSTFRRKHHCRKSVINGAKQKSNFT